MLENTGPDVTKVFGPASDEAAEVVANPGQAFADFVGIAIHCAQGETLCSDANHGRPDLLPQEPGGYSGFNGLFGNKYVAPQISTGPMKGPVRQRHPRTRPATSASPDSTVSSRA